MIFDIHLPYYKQGDDLHRAQESSDSDQEAFRDHADCLRYATEILTELGNFENVRISAADTHMISVTTEHPDSIEALRNADWAQKDMFYDEAYA